MMPKAQKGPTQQKIAQKTKITMPNSIIIKSYQPKKSTKEINKQSIVKTKNQEEKKVQINQEPKQLTKQIILKNSEIEKQIQEYQSKTKIDWYTPSLTSFNDLGQIAEILPKSLYLTNWFFNLVVFFQKLIRDSAENLQALQQLGITHILNITSDTGKYEDYFIYYCIGDISDDDYKASEYKKLIPKIIDFINNNICQGQKVLVHCAAGISRSSTAILAFLMLKANLTLKNAFKFTKLKRNGIWPNSGFMRMLIDLEFEKYKKNTLQIQDDIISEI